MLGMANHMRFVSCTLGGKIAKSHKLTEIIFLFYNFLFLVTQIQHFSVSYVSPLCSKYTVVLISP